MVGQTLGRYAIESKLGAGGMGVVFRARDTQLGRSVAIKVLPADKLVDADRKRRFLREAQTASALNDPHIVSIYDIASDNGTDFIVMEYVPGETLDRLLGPAGLPVPRALAFAIQLAGALAKAHEAGIVHRDLKPSNVIVTDADTVKVLDFGIAKLLETVEPSGDTLTMGATDAHAVVGTPAYMSPEQAEGRRVDARSDIFSLGAVLYEMVTGRRAFSGDSHISILAKVLHEEPEPPTRVRPGQPPELEKVILRCLRKDPARRYQTMADLTIALEDIAADAGPQAAGAPIATAAAPTRAGRTQWLWPIAALTLLAVIAVLFMQRRSAPLVEPMQAVPLMSLPGQVRFPAFSPDGNQVAFTWTGPAQGNQDVYVQQIGAGSPLRLTSDPLNDFSPAWAPDGRSIAFLRRVANSATHEIRLVPPLGGPERRVVEIAPASPIFRPLTIAWCPDSSCVIAPDSQGAGKPDALFAIPIDGGAKRQITFPALGSALDTDAALSPDGRTLVFRRDRTPFTSEMYRVGLSADLSPVGEPALLTDIKMNATRPAWLPNGRDIVFSARNSLWRMDAFRGEAPQRLPFVGQDGSAPAVSRALPDGGARLAYVRLYADANVWRVDAPSPGAPAASAPRAVVASTRADQLPMLSPDGSRLAFFSGRSGEFELWVGDRDGGNAIQLTTLAALPGYARWSPDGETLAFHSDPEGHPDVLTIPSNGGKPRIVTAGPLGGGYPSFSRDGQTIYFSGRDASGRGVIQRIAPEGGAAVVVTDVCAGPSMPSFDARDLYCLEAGDRPSALWRVPLSGAAPTKIVNGVVVFDVTEAGLYYVDRTPVGPDAPGPVVPQTRLRYLDVATGQTSTVGENIGALSAGLSASRDGRTVFYSRIDASADELMVVENLR